MLARSKTKRRRRPSKLLDGSLVQLNRNDRMDLTTTLTGFVALYIFMLAAFTGYEIIGRVPAILHTPLMSGSNFVHGIVVVGAMYALLNASSTTEQVIGFVGVLLGAGNAAGGYVVTERMLEMFKPSQKTGDQKKA